MRCWYTCCTNASALEFGGGHNEVVEQPLARNQTENAPKNESENENSQTKGNKRAHSKIGSEELHSESERRAVKTRISETTSSGAKSKHEKSNESSSNGTSSSEKLRRFLKSLRKIKNKFSPEKRGKNDDIQQQINENRAKLKGKTPLVYSDDDYVMDEEGKTI